MKLTESVLRKIIQEELMKEKKTDSSSVGDNAEIINLLIAAVHIIRWYIDWDFENYSDSFIVRATLNQVDQKRKFIIDNLQSIVIIAQEIIESKNLQNFIDKGFDVEDEEDMRSTSRAINKFIDILKTQFAKNFK